MIEEKQQRPRREAFEPERRPAPGDEVGVRRVASPLGERDDPKLSRGLYREQGASHLSHLYHSKMDGIQSTRSATWTGKQSSSTGSGRP
jgi:hypothetical protein